MNMEHILILDNKGLKRLYEDVFPSIANGETILFLGAGASVSEKKFLSREIIEFYSAKKGIDLNTNDLIEFVDILSADAGFSREKFDDYVVELLRKLQVTDTHRTIASINWKEIITTNYDQLIEKAYDEISGTSRENMKIVPIRRARDYNYNQANDEIKYVKLNGCISDRKRYPLVFSTQDFEKSNAYYKIVLRTLENLSPKINFLSVGFSYSDLFAKTLIQKFDKFNYRNKRWMLSIDPYVEDARLSYFKENRISVIKTTADGFFEEYKKWEAANHSYFVSRKSIKFTNRNNTKISIPDRLAARIGNDLLQLTDYTSAAVISPADFYKGEQPSFDVVRKNIDVVKARLLKDVKNQLSELFAHSHTLLPIVFLVGTFGTGKTTFCYRIIEDVTHDDSFDALAFEVIDASKLKATNLEEVFIKCGSKNIILLFNGIEVDSAFKSLIDFRARLSTEQFHEFKLLLLASIRENILEKHKLRSIYKNTVELTVDVPLTEQEARDLIEKLNSAGLIHFRDAGERNKLVSKVLNEYAGDTFIALISLLSNTNHSKIVRDAFSELSGKAQEALLYTSLLYRFSIPMPASLLRSLISKTWEEFTEEVLEYDSKGIIIQEEKKGVGTDPDIYLRTKHPLLADYIVKIFLPSEDKRFEKYKELLRHINLSKHSSRLVIDLLKAVQVNEDLSKDKIDKLFDECSQIFYEDAHFNLHYATNLQYRNNESSLRKGIERLKYAQSFTEKRNHRLIHRRAVLNFRLAQIIYGRDIELKETTTYIDEARRLFEIKLILDPFSSFSYVEYLRFEMWFLDKVRLDDIDTLRQRILIEDLFDKAEKSLFEGLKLVQDLRVEYLRETEIGKKAYLNSLEELYQDPEIRPYALILKYYYFDNLNDKDRCTELVTELEGYKYLDEVAKVLFRYYGRNLHIANNRIKLLSIVDNHALLKDKDPVRYHYYSYVAHAYNRNFHYIYEHLNKLKGKFHYLNPELHEVWRDADTLKDKIFEGIVRGNNKRKRIKVIELQKSFDLMAGDYSNTDLTDNARHNVHLHFFLNGIRAQIITQAV